MPGSQTYTYDAHNADASLQINVKGDLETTWYGKNKPVYFTDQSPSFDVTIKNTGKLPVDGKIPLYMEYHQGDGRDKKSIDISLSPGDEKRDTFDLDLLTYQGTAVLNVEELGTDPYKSSEDVHVVEKSRTRGYPLYTFMIYDRNYYKVNYLTPRFAQYVGVILSVLIVVSAYIQLILFSQ